MNIEPIKEFYADHLKVQIYPNREKMGKAAADAVSACMRGKQEHIRMIFAAAPSQVEFLRDLSDRQDVNWSNVTAFHMDEYLGLPEDAAQGFGNFLRTRLFDKAPFLAVHYINPAPSDASAECARYAAILQQAPVDIVCMGIGENGHIAFNDPPVADFHDPEMVKVVEMDDDCRNQQVNDGCFDRFADVPTHAITLTVPALMAADAVFVVVPGLTKAQAVFKALKGAITTACPASILRTHKKAVLYLDTDSASHILV